MADQRRPQPFQPTSKKVGLLRNIHGEPDQLLIIQWSASIFLSLAIGWNSTVDAYLGHEPRFDSETGAFIENIPTRYHPIGPDTLLFLLGIAGGSGSMYNWRRGQDRRTEVEKERIRVLGNQPAHFPEGDPTLIDMESQRG